jgi:hypothetical protein
VLIEARGIHEDEGRWAHLAGMGDCENTFCVIAAANHRKYRRRDQGWFEIEPYIDAALRDMNYRYSVVSFSYDEKTTHPMLMEMWDRAIAARRAEIGS